MAMLQIREAIRDAMKEEMERDENVFLLGEEVGQLLHGRGLLSQDAAGVFE